MKDMLAKLKHLKAESLVISDRSNSEAAAAAERAVCIDTDLSDNSGALPSEVWTPIPYVIPAQLFAAHLAEQKGLDPDSPRALSKVTRTM
jgi:glucosamine--fructose-6-phosphate aminotransferase (isomerizing)